MSPIEQEPVSPDPVIQTLSDYETWAYEHLPYPRGTPEAIDFAQASFNENSALLTEALRGNQTEQIMYTASETLWSLTLASANADINFSDSLRIVYREAFPRLQPILTEDIDVSAREFFFDLRKERAVTQLEHNHVLIARAALSKTIIDDELDYDLHTSSFSEQWIRIKRGRAMKGLANASLISSMVVKKFGIGSFGDALGQIRARH